MVLSLEFISQRARFSLWYLNVLLFYLSVLCWCENIIINNTGSFPSLCYLLISLYLSPFLSHWFLSVLLVHLVGYDHLSFAFFGLLFSLFYACIYFINTHLLVQWLYHSSCMFAAKHVKTQRSLGKYIRLQFKKMRLKHLFSFLHLNFCNCKNVNCCTDESQLKKGPFKHVYTRSFKFPDEVKAVY